MQPPPGWEADALIPVLIVLGLAMGLPLGDTGKGLSGGPS